MLNFKEIEENWTSRNVMGIFKQGLLHPTSSEIGHQNRRHNLGGSSKIWLNFSPKVKVSKLLGNFTLLKGWRHVGSIGGVISKWSKCHGNGMILWAKWWGILKDWGRPTMPNKFSTLGKLFLLIQILQQSNWPILGKSHHRWTSETLCIPLGFPMTWCLYISHQDLKQAAFGDYFLPLLVQPFGRGLSSFWVVLVFLLFLLVPGCHFEQILWFHSSFSKKMMHNWDFQNPNYVRKPPKPTIRFTCLASESWHRHNKMKNLWAFATTLSPKVCWRLCQKSRWSCWMATPCWVLERKCRLEKGKWITGQLNVIV